MQSKGLSKVFSAPQFKSINSLVINLLMVQLSDPYMITGKTTALTIWTFVSKVMSLLVSTLSRFATAFLPRNKHHEAQRNPSTHTDTSFQSLQVQAAAFSPPCSVSRFVSYIRSLGFNCSQQEEEGKVHLLHLPRSRSLFLMSSQIMI